MARIRAETDAYETQAQETLRKLAEAEEDIKAGAKGSTHEDVMLRMRARLQAKS